MLLRALFSNYHDIFQLIRSLAFKYGEREFLFVDWKVIWLVDWNIETHAFVTFIAHQTWAQRSQN